VDLVTFLCVRFLAGKAQFPDVLTAGAIINGTCADALIEPDSDACNSFEQTQSQVGPVWYRLSQVRAVK
jgi:hypothetical protein